MQICAGVHVARVCAAGVSSEAMRRASAALAIGALLVGCQAANTGASWGFGESLPEMTAGSTSTSGATSEAATGTTGSTSQSSDDSTAGPGSSSSTLPLQDLGGQPDFGPLQPPGCKGKIDFLFVVSRENVMQTIQQRIIDAFASFHATIAAEFADFDYHIMVVDGDPEWGLDTCNENCSVQGCGIADYPCDYVNTISVCDHTIGAGTVFNAGAQASNTPCAVADGIRYLTKEQPNLAETFACIAQVGTSGREGLGEAVASALSPGLTGPGGCNEGFLRDDALLMITFVMGGYDIASHGTPEEWSQSILDAKKGDPGSIVMFGFFAPNCVDDKNDQLCQMVKGFPHWQVESNLVEDYGPAFLSATEMVADACSDFIPK
jgi:hypothetical protein